MGGAKGVRGRQPRMPVGQAWLGPQAVGGVVRMGGLIFELGVSIAMPVAFAMVLVQIVMAMIGRSAPSLNLFSVGIPAALLAGIALMAVALPVMAETVSRALDEGLAGARTIAQGGHGR
jgi:flagellar biosynthesis protein FliR